MNPDLRALMENALETFEGGRFQDFCLDFLPIYHARFEGLARLGHTAGGKTRAGTPDLLKTAGERQIAVQCGTDQDYWPPETSIATSKPYRDAMQCIRTLPNLDEIVLVTNRETPAHTPNVRAAISAAVGRETTATLTLLGREDLGQYLAANVTEPRIAALIAHYFPILARVLETQQEAKQHRILQKIAHSERIELGAALRVVEDAIRAKTGVDEATAYALEQAQALNACRLRQLPPFAGIVRASVAALPLAAPFGKVWALTGVPKAGKTNALRQLVATWGDENVVWFDCPIAETDTCSDEIGAAILRPLLPDEVPGPLLGSAARLETALKHATTPTSTVIVADNADRLSEAGLGRLAVTLAVLRRHGALTHLACVFVAASGLHRLRPAVDEVLTTPAWSIDELREFLSRAGVVLDPERPDKYLETLEARSGGHPLVALALARRHPQFGDLVLSSLQHVPGLADEGLSREVQQLLYAELLTDADAQNLVQRASLFVERIPHDVMEALRTTVSPQIATATAVLLDRLSPTVIEGTAGDGYHVAFVFGEIAKHKVSAEEQRAVNEAAANVLLRPIGRTLPADRICWGIFHAMLAMQVERALMWTAVLGRAALAQHLQEGQIRALLDQLKLVSVIVVPPDLAGQLAHAVAFMTLGQLYARVGDHGTAADLFARIRMDKAAVEAPEVAQEMPAFRLAIALGRATYLLAADRPGARSIVTALGETEFAAMTPAQWDVTLEVLAQIVFREGLTNGFPATIATAVATVDPGDVAARAAGLRLGAAVGFTAGLVEGAAVSLPVCFPDTPFGQLLQGVAEGTFAMQRGDVRTARARLAEASELARGNGWATGAAWGELQGHRGDAAYSAGDRAAAISAYSEARKESDPNSHMRPWSAWRLGFLQEDVPALTEAVDRFRELGDTATWARALGARGAVRLKGGRDAEGLADLGEVLDAYYRDGNSAAAPAATVAQAHIARYEAAQAGSPKADDDPAFPVFAAEPYDGASSSWVPRAGPVFAFYALGTVFRSTDDAAARRYFRQAADAQPRNDVDRDARPLAISTLIGLLGSAGEDAPEIERRFVQLLTEPSATGRALLFASVIFGPEHPNGTVTDAVRFERVIEAVSRGIAAVTGRDVAFWESEVLAGRARLAAAEGAEGGVVARLWNEALDKARPDTNARIMLRAGLAIGFEYPEYTTGFRHLARYQFECLRGAELTGTAPAFLGHNLLQLWTHLGYKQLSANDLETKQTLMDPANEMKRAGVRNETAAAAMVLLLARLFRHRGPASDWAEAELQGHWEELPDDVRSHLATD